MPLDRVEFVSVVRTLTQLSSDITSRKKTRSVEENDLLTLAKQRLCENYGISEREAHRFRREGKSVLYSLADGHIQTILAQGMEHIGE